MMNREQRIYKCLQTNLSPIHLEVLNESNRHHVPDGSETHFKCTIVSTKFLEMSKIQRHKHLYTLLNDELQNGLHALSLHLYTPTEWEAIQQSPSSPSCRDGYDK